MTYQCLVGMHRVPEHDSSWQEYLKNYLSLPTCNSMAARSNTQSEWVGLVISRNQSQGFSLFSPWLQINGCAAVLLCFWRLSHASAFWSNSTGKLGYSWFSGGPCLTSRKGAGKKNNSSRQGHSCHHIWLALRKWYTFTVLFHGSTVKLKLQNRAYLSRSVWQIITLHCLDDPRAGR